VLARHTVQTERNNPLILLKNFHQEVGIKDDSGKKKKWVFSFIG
jgi:hypothetical protein